MVSTITLARAFRRHVECPDETIEVDAAVTVGDALTAYFCRHPAVRSYVLDDTGVLRRHVTVFLDDAQLSHRDAVGRAARPDLDHPPVPSTVRRLTPATQREATTMRDLLIGTRKGLFRLHDGDVSVVGFLGVPVTNVVRDGRHTLHLMFMAQYTELWNAVDPIAERIRSLGHPAPGSYAQFGKLSSIKDAPATPPKALEMVRDPGRGPRGRRAHRARHLPLGRQGRRRADRRPADAAPDGARADSLDAAQPARVSP